MNHEFISPFVSRARTTDESKQGFDIVHVGLIVLEENSLYVFEREDYENDNNATPIVSIDISKLDRISSKKFRSASGKHHGGKIELVGTFDRPWKEILTFKMELDEYRRLKDALNKIQTSYFTATSSST
jgi:hypothetical protein